MSPGALPDDRSRKRSCLLGVAASAAVLAAIAMWAVRSHRVPWSADQAVVGLMAGHILAGRGHPVFYWGAAYAGTLETHWVAAVFEVVGATVASYRVSMGILVLLLLLGVFFLAQRAFGARASVFALAYLAVPPFFLLYKGLTSDGVYDTVALLGLAAVSLALGIDRRLGQGGSPVWLLLLLGAVIGAGWWVMPVTAAVSAAALSWLFLRRQPRPSAGAALWIAAGAVAGSFPWWFWNLRHGWASLKAAEMGLVGPAQAAQNLLRLIRVTLPVLEGGMSVSPDIHKVRETFPLASFLSVGALALLVVPAIRDAARGDRTRRLLLLALGAVLLLPPFSVRFVASEPRYAMAYYALAPALLGAEIARRSHRTFFRRASLAAGCALLAVHVASLASARVSFSNEDQEVTGDLTPLIRSLEAAGIHDVYANYWTAYRLSFESRERVIATPLTGDETVRYASYREAVDRAGSPAVVLLEPRDACFGAFLEERGISYRRESVGPFGVYFPVGGAGLANLRAGMGLPLPRVGYRVSWQLGMQPSTMSAGERTAVRVEVSNRGPCLWPVSVHLGYHWWPLEAGLEAVYDGRRGYLSSGLRPGDSATIPIELDAPAAPGLYRLEYDLVHENVAWFSGQGGQTAAIEVRVTPAQGPRTER